MTLEKVEVATYESYPFFTPSEAKKNKTVLIVSQPKIVTLKNYNNKKRLFVNVKISEKPEYKSDLEDLDQRNTGDIRTWSMNGQSQNKAIDLLGDEEADWVNKSLPVEVLKQVVNKKKKDVIYVEGAIQEDDEV